METTSGVVDLLLRTVVFCDLVAELCEQQKTVFGISSSGFGSVTVLLLAIMSQKRNRWVLSQQGCN